MGEGEGREDLEASSRGGFISRHNFLVMFVVTKLLF